MAKRKQPKRTGGKNQYSPIKGLGDLSYPPLIIKSVDGKIRLDAKYIFLENYSEKYDSKMQFEHIFGQINPRVTYATTDRTIDISFVLAARNVHEAKANLDYCSKLGRSPYGVYLIDNVEEFDDEYRFDWSYNNQRTYVVDFGTFLRDQAVKVSNFEFSVNVEAGVFDYGSTPVTLKDLSPDERVYKHLSGQGYLGGPLPEPAEKLGKVLDTRWWSKGGQPSSILEEQDYIYHGHAGAVYPKEISVNISMVAFHARPLCFGGTGRADGSIGWSLDENLDWPHGTGPLAASPYCRRDSNTGNAQNSNSPVNKQNEPVTVGKSGAGENDILVPEGTTLLEDEFIG